MPEKLFDLSKEYDYMLNRGIRYSGEDKFYFIRGRVNDLAQQLPSDFQPVRVLDWGCGIGDTTHYLSEVFPEACITGTDLSEEAIAYARDKYGSEKLRFVHLNELENNYLYDLCYVNGVFHHIAPGNRGVALDKIYAALKPGAYFAFFENNPWNPGTLVVMKSIPFDRNAQPVSFVKAKRLLKKAGFCEGSRSRFLFFFPKIIGFLRFLEPFFVKVPFGAQYYILAQKQINHSNALE
jgi:SAM-dependent methyltransferase